MSAAAVRGGMGDEPRFHPHHAHRFAEVLRATARARGWDSATLEAAAARAGLSAAEMQQMGYGHYLPGWRRTQRFLLLLGLHRSEIDARFRRLHPATAGYREALALDLRSITECKLCSRDDRATATIAALGVDSDAPGQVTRHGKDAIIVRVDPAGPGAVPPPEPALPDVDGYDLKPDPMQASSLEHLEELLRLYWIWAGKYSSRRLARDSGGAFSHATISKLLHDKPGKPPLKLSYVTGLVRACGGDRQEQSRWATAWRLIQREARMAHDRPDTESAVIAAGLQLVRGYNGSALV